MPPPNQPKNPAEQIAKARQAATEIRLHGLGPGARLHGLFAMDKRVIAVSDDALYEVKMADWIDPGRTNPTLTNMQRKILKRGAASGSVSRTLLTAEVLSQPGFMKELDRDALLKFTLEGALCLSSMADDRDVFVDFENSVQKSLPSISTLGTSIAVPYQDDLEARTKSFFLNANHCMRSLLNVVGLFYGDDYKKGYFEGFRDKLLKSKGDQVFSGYLTKNLNFIKFLKEIRNAIEHPKPDMQVITNNYRLLPSGELGGPSFELRHPKFPQPEVGLPSFLAMVIDGVETMYEEILVLLFNQNLAKINGVELGVVSVPAERRRYGAVRYEITVLNLPEQVGSDDDGLKTSTKS